MNAVLRSALRADTWSGDALTPESSHHMPSGNRMPLLGLGTLKLNHHTVQTVGHAFEAGFRMVDTSPQFHTQRGIGDAIRACGFERDEIFVITKVESGEDSYAALHKSLGQMRLQYVDLVLIHGANAGDGGEMAWHGLRRAKRDGLTHDIGVCNYSIDGIEDLVYRTGEMPSVNQVEWSPFGHSPRMLDFCHDNGILIQASSPLTRASRLNDDKVSAMAARYGKTPAQLLIRWNLQLGVVPLPKANHSQHLRDNLQVFDFDIATQDMMRLNGLNQHFSAFERLAYL